jgi:general secretion pathway protein J
MRSEKASNSFFFIKKYFKNYPSSYLKKSSFYFLRKGLTLIELSIVVALLGVIFTGIFSTYYTSLKISRSTTPKGGTSRQDIFFAIENIRSTLSQTYYVDGHRNLVFVGKTDGVQNARRDMVTFAANHPNAEEIGSPAIREVTFFLKPMQNSPDEFNLIRREDEMVDKDPFNGGIEHILLDHVTSFQLKYSQRGDKWQDDWDTKDIKKVPKLIRIELIALVGDTEMKYESLAYPGIFFK